MGYACGWQTGFGNIVRVTRFYTTPDGGSAFDEFVMPVEHEGIDQFGNRLLSSDSFLSPAIKVFRAPIGMFQDWHNAPTRQLCVMMEGIWEIGTTNGEKRRWGPGEVFMPDTVKGKGHTSEVIEGPVSMFFIPVPDEVDISVWGALTTSD